MAIIFRCVLEHSDIIGLLIDLIALIVSIVLTFIIYRLERRHEEEHEAAEEKAQKMAMAEAAKVFLIDNDDEVEYLSLAEIAAKLNLKRKHCRSITTRFLRCSEAQQREILHQANIADIQVSTEAVSAALKSLQSDLDKYEFGRSILYDGAKYLHRAFERWSDFKISDVNPYIFENIESREWHDTQSVIPWYVTSHSATLSNYMGNYMHAEKQNRQQITPPVDMVFQQCNLGFCDEQMMTFWTMRIIIDACHTFSDISHCDDFDESLIQTQEDMYYYTLATLCTAYPTEGGTVNDKA